MRSTRLSRKRFLALKRELVAHMKELGYSFRFSQRRINWSETTPSVGGYFQEFKREIVVYAYGRCGHANILHTIAHELRHAIHERTGLYKDYYSLNFEMMLIAMKGQKVQWKWPNLGVAIRAERDCDRWADKWLKDRGITYIQKNIYSFESTMAYTMSKRMKAYEQGVRMLQEKQIARLVHETQFTEGRTGIVLPGVQSGEAEEYGKLPLRETEAILERMEEQQYGKSENSQSQS